ncbi:MAG: hypothetical protein ABR529_12305 [Actinomycetota bacterium]
MGNSHLIGMLLGTEEDWPRTFEALMRRLGPNIKYRGETHRVDIERITIEPFSLRAVPRYSLVIDRLAYWYYNPREWLKKIALIDRVYLLNNPFTFQSMEKHAAYCAMIRLGLRIPETWLLPHKMPPENERFPYTAARYNRPFELGDIGAHIGFPLYMKPFDGGAWVGVTRIEDGDQLQRRYDESGRRLMHLQTAVEDFDVFARTLSIGAESLTVRYEPSLPLHDRYRVEHDFLSPELGREITMISRLVNAFFLWELNSCEIIVKNGIAHPIDYANASPDLSLISLHYYFPWAIKTLAKWCLFSTVTGRRMPIDQDTERYFAIGDDGELSYEDRLERYGELSDAFFAGGDYHEFCAEHLASVDEVMVELIESDEFDRIVVDTITSSFPSHEHEQFVAHYRGLLRAWANDQRARAGS